MYLMVLRDIGIGRYDSTYYTLFYRVVYIIESEKHLEHFEINCIYYFLYHDFIFQRFEDVMVFPF